MWDHRFRSNSHPIHNNLILTSGHIYKGRMVPLQATRENVRISPATVMWLTPEMVLYYN